MNFLSLCKRARQEAGITGEGPTQVANNAGQLGRLVGWVSQAWEDVQLSRPDWNFMNAEFTFDTDIDVRDYRATDKSLDDVKLWDTGSLMVYKKSVGENDQNVLAYKKYARWRAEHRNQMNTRASDRPQNFTVLPNNSLRFEPKPDDVYTIDGEYKRKTQKFTADDDEPTGLPEDFHMIIVWQALKYYGFYENAPEVLDEAETNYGSMIVRLEIEQLPEISEDFTALA